YVVAVCFFFSSRRRHTRLVSDWSSDVCSSDLVLGEGRVPVRVDEHRVRLLAVRDGRLTWNEFHAWRSRLAEEFEAAFAGTRLPRSEERRVGKERRCRRAAEHAKR